MHQINFGFKRNHLLSLALTRPFAEQFNLTPARFDMLLAIYHRRRGATTQADLRDVLGVCPPVISRMARSLEELGFIARERLESDKRKVLVTFTARGFFLFKRALHKLLHSGVIDRAVGRVPPLSRKWRRDMLLGLSDSLLLMRNGFKDIASLLYVWHPDD